MSKRKTIDTFFKKKDVRASTTGNLILSYFTISKSYFINYTIPFYNTPNIPKLYFFPILFKYSFLIFSYYFSFSLPFPLFRPQPLAPTSTSSKPIPTTMNLTNHTHRHPYPRPKPITKTARPSNPRRSQKQTTRHGQNNPYPRPKPIPKTTRPSTPRRSHKLPSPPSTTPLLHHLPPQQNHNKKSIPKSPKSNKQITTNLKPKPKLHSTTIETTT